MFLSQTRSQRSYPVLHALSWFVGKLLESDHESSGSNSEEARMEKSTTVSSARVWWRVCQRSIKAETSRKEWSMCWPAGWTPHNISHVYCQTFGTNHTEHCEELVFTMQSACCSEAERYGSRTASFIQKNIPGEDELSSKGKVKVHGWREDCCRTNEVWAFQRKNGFRNLAAITSCNRGAACSTELQAEFTESICRTFLPTIATLLEQRTTASPHSWHSVSTT